MSHSNIIKILDNIANSNLPSDAVLKQMKYLRMVDYDFKSDDQPEIILQSFNKTVTNYEDARLVAVMFKELYGDIIICKNIFTIVEYIENDIIENDYIYEAFYDLFGDYEDHLERLEYHYNYRSRQN